MKDVLELLNDENAGIPAEVKDLVKNCKSCTVFNSTADLADASTGGKENSVYQVAYDVEGKGEYVEATVHRVKNGISANYTEPYMRRRDPNTMAIADDKPTDKAKFIDKYGYEFSSLREETFEWLKTQDLAVFFYFAGTQNIGSGGVAIAPANAAFFAMGLSMLQKIVPISEIGNDFKVESAIFVAPPFRHTHFEGKQVVVHNRLDNCHEMFAYNLYPGPSAKKGLYGVLLSKGEQEGWITAHCSTVQVASPYDNVTTFMHEGASGGGKTEMLQHIVREENGLIKIGENLKTGEERHISLPLFCKFNPVTDDMAMCHPSVQSDNGKLGLVDAENAWFIRTDGVLEYGDDPFLENLTINTKDPLLFLNIEAEPNTTALIWDHIEDEPGKTCPNPRVVIPRDAVPNVAQSAVHVDIRSFGVRTPPTSAEHPSYGIVGMFHLLPPALAWLWRLVSPRGYGNPSIVGSGEMGSEGVGSYWPFATGKKIDQANLLLDQIVNTPDVRYTLTPNQHIGVWKVGFKPQLLMREYLTRRGSANLKKDQFQEARCPLLGYELNYLTIEASKIPSRFLKVYKQPEVGEQGYDAGAEVLFSFFEKELNKFRQSNLSDLGKNIIEACLSKSDMQAYIDLIPMDYEYKAPAE